MRRLVFGYTVSAIFFAYTLVSVLTNNALMMTIGLAVSLIGAYVLVTTVHDHLVMIKYRPR